MTVSLSSSLAKAIKDLQAGRFKGNVAQLLERARTAIDKKEAQKLKQEKISAKEAWDSHNLFKKRLEVILTEKIKVENLEPGESLMWCYVTSFYATPESHRSVESPREATITIRGADIRICTDEDIAPPHSNVQVSDRYGCYYREIDRSFGNFTFPERWLWEDDWISEFKRCSLQSRLHMARYNRKQAIERVAEVTFKRLPEMEAHVLTLTKECETIAAEMSALGMDIPKEDPDA